MINSTKIRSETCRICGESAYRFLDKVVAMCIRCKNAYYAYWKRLVDFFSEQPEFNQVSSLEHTNLFAQSEYVKWIVSFFKTKNCKLTRPNKKVCMSLNNENGYTVCKKLCAKCRFYVWLFQRYDIKGIPASISSRIRIQHPTFYKNYSASIKRVGVVSRMSIKSLESYS